MEQYIVSARKYRPDNFGTLIGQDNIARTLKNSILRGQLAHISVLRAKGCGQDHHCQDFCKNDQLLKPVSGYGALRGM